MVIEPLKIKQFRWALYDTKYYVIGMIKLGLMQMWHVARPISTITRSLLEWL